MDRGELAEWMEIDITAANPLQREVGSQVPPGWNTMLAKGVE
jgi:hypothetical protein